MPNPITQLPDYPITRFTPSALCAIVDVDACGGRGLDPLDTVRAFLSGGATFLQLRAKHLGSAAFLTLASDAAALVHTAGARLIVNDRADIAALASADGVHVGQDDLSVVDVRRIVGAGATVGLSTHTTDQLERAVEAPVDYVAVGPVFGTVTKKTGYDAIGLGMVAAAAVIAASRGLPLVAIGGITLERARAVIDAGATSVAVIGDLLVTTDLERRVREFISAVSV